MTDPPSTPPVPPPWLKFECFEKESGKTYYSLARGANKALFEAVRGQSSWKTLEEWTVVRSRIAEALGLVEPPEEGKWQVIAEVFVARTTAQELRRLAEHFDYNGGCEQREGLGEASDQLRKRADELDPTEPSE